MGGTQERMRRPTIRLHALARRGVLGDSPHFMARLVALDGASCWMSTAQELDYTTTQKIEWVRAPAPPGDTVYYSYHTGGLVSALCSRPAFVSFSFRLMTHELELVSASLIPSLSSDSYPLPFPSFHLPPPPPHPLPRRLIELRVRYPVFILLYSCSVCTPSNTIRTIPLPRPCTCSSPRLALGHPGTLLRQALSPPTITTPISLVNPRHRACN